jgi:hypothetical protein
MLQISQVCIISIDKSDDTWAIEGEIIFEDDLSTAFEVSYVPDEDELEDLSMELDIDDFDTAKLKEMIISSAMEYEDDF